MLRCEGRVRMPAEVAAGVTPSSPPAPDALRPEGGNALTAASIDLIGRSHGRRYRVIELAGRGGEGVVLRAVDLLRRREVAIKVRPAPSSGECSRLLAETRLLFSLNPHRGVPVLREDFFAGGLHVMVTDWVEGTALSAVLQDCGRLPYSVVHGWMAQLASILDHLHGHRPAIVHRDVKPSNLLLGPDGSIALVDFGISGTFSETQPGRPAVLCGDDGAKPAGSPGFVAPLTGVPGDGGITTDVYALTATFLTLVAGSVPDPARPPCWSAIHPDGPEALERAVRAGLAIDPRRRPQSAAGLLALFPRPAETP